MSNFIDKAFNNVAQASGGKVAGNLIDKLFGNSMQGENSSSAELLKSVFGGNQGQYTKELKTKSDISSPGYEKSKEDKKEEAIFDNENPLSGGDKNSGNISEYKTTAAQKAESGDYVADPWSLSMISGDDYMNLTPEKRDEWEQQTTDMLIDAMFLLPDILTGGTTAVARHGAKAAGKALAKQGLREAERAGAEYGTKKATQQAAKEGRDALINQSIPRITPVSGFYSSAGRGIKNTAGNAVEKLGEKLPELGGSIGEGLKDVMPKSFRESKELKNFRSLSKEAGEEAAEGAAKEVGKEAAEEATKEGAEEAVENGFGNAVKNTAGKMGTLRGASKRRAITEELASNVDNIMNDAFAGIKKASDEGVQAVRNAESNIPLTAQASIAKGGEVPKEFTKAYAERQKAAEEAATNLSKLSTDAEKQLIEQGERLRGPVKTAAQTLAKGAIGVTAPFMIGNAMRNAGIDTPFKPFLYPETAHASEYSDENGYDIEQRKQAAEYYKANGTWPEWATQTMRDRAVAENLVPSEANKSDVTIAADAAQGNPNNKTSKKAFEDYAAANPERIAELGWEDYSDPYKQGWTNFRVNATPDDWVTVMNEVPEFRYIYGLNPEDAEAIKDWYWASRRNINDVYNNGKVDYDTLKAFGADAETFGDVADWMQQNGYGWGDGYDNPNAAMRYLLTAMRTYADPDDLDFTPDDYNYLFRDGDEKLKVGYIDENNGYTSQNRTNAPTSLDQIITNKGGVYGVELMPDLIYKKSGEKYGFK